MSTFMTCVFNYTEDTIIYISILYSAHNMFQEQHYSDKCAPAPVISCNKTQKAILSNYGDIGGSRDGDQRNR